MFKKKVLLLLALVILPLWLVLPNAALAAEQKLVAITFDDGPGKYTDGLLDELAKRDVVVTFFVQGVNADRYSSVIKKAFEAGHQIASHTYNHPNLVNLSDAEVKKQLNRTIEILDKATGRENAYMLRPPYGSYNDRVLGLANCPVILWSVDTLDWKSRRADAVYQHIVNDTRDGSIILMHDLYDSTVAGALRGIDYLQQQGYELVTVSELLRRRGVTPSAGSRYSSAYNNSVNLPGIAAPAIEAVYTEGRYLVSITADAGATIYYTLDGSRPTSQSQVYAGPIELGEKAEIKAFAAFNLNGARSRVTEAYLYCSPKGNIFMDIKPESWCSQDVDWAVAAGLMTTNKGRFFPDGLVSRQNLVTVLYRLAGSPPLEEVQPPDKEAGMAADSVAVRWAAEQGLITGYADGTFEPNEPVTREQLAVILYRFGGTSSMEDQQALAGFADSGSISPYAREAMGWVVSQGIFTGVSENRLEPGSAITRAELATIVLRCQSVWAESFGETVREMDLKQKGRFLCRPFFCVNT